MINVALTFIVMFTLFDGVTVIAHKLRSRLLLRSVVDVTGSREDEKMNKNDKAWDIVFTLFLLVIVGGMFVFVALWSTLPILSLTTDWAWAQKLTALFWELGLYK